MISVLLTSELPWQHNDAITFFYLPLYFAEVGVLFRNCLVASVMAKFEQILQECFGNILKQSSKGRKNSDKHTINIIC